MDHGIWPGIVPNMDESWRQAVRRYAIKWGIEAEVLEDFDHLVAEGIPEAKAAWMACWEWDVSELE